MSLFKNFKSDTKSEAENGVTLDYGADGRFHVRRAGGANKRFGEVLSAKLKPHRRKIDLGMMDNDLASRLMAEAYAETIVLGWDGGLVNPDEPKGDVKPFKPDGETELPFSKANVVKLLTELPEFFRQLQSDCEDVSNFRSEAIDTDKAELKNA